LTCEDALVPRPLALLASPCPDHGVHGRKRLLRTRGIP